MEKESWVWWKGGGRGEFVRAETQGGRKGVGQCLLVGAGGLGGA